jgi:hypothetical protein
MSRSAIRSNASSTLPSDSKCLTLSTCCRTANLCRLSCHASLSWSVRISIRNYMLPNFYSDIPTTLEPLAAYRLQSKNAAKQLFHMPLEPRAYKHHSGRNSRLM